MTALFRRIRRKLITEGNLKRYLFYAVGEILLVVIGILIALQINNWRTDVSNQKLEKLFFLELIVDLKRDSMRLAFLTDYYNNRVENIGWLLTAVRNPGLPVDELDLGVHLEPLYYGVPSMHNATTYESAKSSGHFNLFRKNEIIKQLTQYYTEVGLVDDILTATQGIIYSQLEPIMADYSLDYLGSSSGAQVIASVDVGELYEFMGKIQSNRQKRAAVVGVLLNQKFESYLIGDLGRAFHALSIIRDRQTKLSGIVVRVMDIRSEK